MLQYELLQKRNTFIFFSYVFSFFLYNAMILFGMFNEIYVNFDLFTILAIVILTILYSKKVNAKIQLVSLLLCWNLSITLIVIESNQFIVFYLYIFFILLVTIYQSKLLNFIVAGICSIQVAFFLIFNYSELLINLTKFPSIYLFFLLLLFCTGFMQISYIRYLWKKTEQSNINREIELSSTEAYLKMFFEQAEDAIAVFDLDDKVITVNPAFERLYGWSKEECIGTSLPLVPPEYIEAAQERLGRILKGEKLKLVETQDMKKDGTYFDAQISLSPIYNHHGEMIAVSCISRDISYIKETEQLLMQSEKLKLAGEIAAGVAHEIRNPMTVISGFIQMMNADENSPYRQYTEIIYSKIKRIELIVDEFLVLSKPQVTHIELINITNILYEIEQFFSLECQKRNINFKIINNADVTINGNINRIKQVFINLIKNAIEAIGENGNILLEIYRQGENIYILLKDDGIGIPEKVLNRIFEPFYTTKSKGTGLGMMIINKIIQEHKGSIKVTSKENIGTEISLKLPIAK